jgi:hypothetical protein
MILSKKKCIDFLVVSFHVNPILRLIRTQREKINKKTSNSLELCSVIEK